MSSQDEIQPLLSVIVPVYNGSKKLEKTLEKIQAKLDQLESVMWNVEVERSEVEHSLLTTGQFPEANAPAVTAIEQQRLMMYAGGMGATNVSVPSGSKISEASAKPTGIRKWYELIVVNDGSKDNTRSVIDKVCEKDDRIRSISYSVNQGKGYAIKQGVLHSSGRYVLFMDGDGEISADVLAKYLKKLSRSHIVIGSKNHRGSVVKAPLSRRFFSKCFQIYARKSLGLSVHDTQVGLKAGRGEVFRKIFGRVQVKRYAFDAEMLAIAKLMDLKVVELPVKIELEKSFKKKEIVRMALDVLGVAFRLRVIKWYQKNMEKKRPQYRLPMIF